MGDKGKKIRRECAIIQSTRLRFLSEKFETRPLRGAKFKGPGFCRGFKFCSFPGSNRGPKGCGETVPAVGGEQRYLEVHSGLSVRRGLAPS